MKKQNFLKASLILMISAVIAKGLGALFKIPLTNLLGGVGMGYFSCAYSLFMPVYALAVTGLSSAVARMTAQSTASGKYADALEIRRTALVLFSAVGLAGSILVFLTARPFSIYTVGSSKAYLATAMISPSVFFGCITAVERGYYEGTSNMYPTALSQVAEGVIKVCSGLLMCNYVNSHSELFLSYFPDVGDIRAISASAGILGVTLSSAGAMLFMGAVRFFGKSREVRGKSNLSRRKICRELISIAFPTGISAVVTNLTALIDMWTIIGGIECKGSLPDGVSRSEYPDFVYGSFAGMALTVFNLVPSVTNMLGKGVLPCITEAWEKKDKMSLEKNTLQALVASAVIAVPSSVGIGVLSPYILEFLFPLQSAERAVCGNSLRILMTGMVFLCMSYPVFSMLQAVGKPYEPLKIMLIGTGVKLAGNLLFIPVMQINGASLSTSLCYGTIFAVSLARYIKLSGTCIRPLIFVKILYSGLLCGASAWLVSDLLSRSGTGVFLTLLLSVSAGGAVYIFSAIMVCGKRILKRSPTAVM